MKYIKYRNKKIALLTGAAGGIGREIAMLLDREGYQQVLVDINQDGLNSLAESLKTPPLCIATDITNASSVEVIERQVRDEFGRLDVLINNAGVIVTTPVQETPFDKIDTEIDVNYKACLYLVRAFAPLMIEQKSGQIISVSSLGGIIPLKESPGYCGSKFALRGFMLSLGMALKEYGIKVTALYPTAIDTPMLLHEALNGGSLMNFLSKPLHPSEVAKAVAKALKKQQMEIAIPESSGFFCKVMGAFPGLIPMLHRAIEPFAVQNRKHYVDEKSAQVLLKGESYESKDIR